VIKSKSDYRHALDGVVIADRPGGALLR